VWQLQNLTAGLENPHPFSVILSEVAFQIQRRNQNKVSAPPAIKHPTAPCLSSASVLQLTDPLTSVLKSQMAEKLHPYGDEEKAYHGGELRGVPSSETDMGELIVATRPNIFKKLNHFLSRLGGEERGIERILPHEKTDQVRIWRLYQSNCEAPLRQFLSLDECKFDSVHVFPRYHCP
jgi:hypothetical protein